MPLGLSERGLANDVFFGESGKMLNGRFRENSRDI